MANRLAVRVGLIVALVVLLAGGAWAAFVESPDSEQSHRATLSSDERAGSRALSEEARADGAGGTSTSTCAPAPDGYGGYSSYGYYGGYGSGYGTCTEEPASGTPGGGKGQGSGGGYGNANGDGGYGNGNGYGGSYGSGYGR